MLKFEFFNKEKSIIRHNLVPEMLIEIIKLDRPNDYQSANLSFDDIFDEKRIKGWHFVFLVLNDEDFEDVDDFTHIRSILKQASKWYQAKVAMKEIDLKPYNPELAPFEDDSFKLMKGKNPNFWLIAHKPTSVIIEFENKKFNETQKISELTPIDLDMMSYARLMREVGKWLAINHSNLI